VSAAVSASTVVELGLVHPRLRVDYVDSAHEADVAGRKDGGVAVDARQRADARIACCGRLPLTGRVAKIDLDRAGVAAEEHAGAVILRGQKRKEHRRPAPVEIAAEARLGNLVSHVVARYRVVARAEVGPLTGSRSFEVDRHRRRDEELPVGKREHAGEEQKPHAASRLDRESHLLR
jgi:hypothetical protein